MRILHLDSSIQGSESVSRTLSAEIVARQRALHPGATVTYRDLAADPVLHLAGIHVAAWQGQPASDAAIGADVAMGDAYIEELFAADIIVIGAPMYNLSVPSQLKAWIDRVAVAGRTFRYGGNGQVESLLPKGKKVLIASSRGGVYTGGSPAAPFDHQETYLTGVLGFLGLNDVTIVRAEGVKMGPEAHAAALAKARADIAALAA